MNTSSKEEEGICESDRSIGAGRMDLLAGGRGSSSMMVRTTEREVETKVPIRE